MCFGGKKVKTEPVFGMTEKFNSAIADSKLVQAIDPLNADFEKSAENTSYVTCFTLNTWAGSETSGRIGEGSTGLKTVECAGRVLSFCLRCWTRISGAGGSI